MEAQVRSFFVTDDGEVPNNANLPVIVYEGAFRTNPNDAEAIFNNNGWNGSWSGGVYDYHHFHSNTHEVLGVRSGSATLLIGGDAGERIEVKAGDVMVLPAGTAHKKLESSDDFMVVGAYPGGGSPNLRKRSPEDRAQSIKEIQSVPVPKRDPVYGDDGPLLHKWNK